MADALVDIDCAPLFADDLDKMPPTLVFTCQYDILHDDGECVRMAIIRLSRCNVRRRVAQGRRRRRLVDDGRRDFTHNTEWLPFPFRPECACSTPWPPGLTAAQARTGRRTSLHSEYAM
jgi:hypothetical protein